MNEEQIPISTATYIPAETSIFDNPYEKEVQEDIWRYEKKKTMLALFAIGAILLISNIIGFASADALDTSNLLTIVLIPAIFLGLGVFAQLQPMIAAIGGIVVILAITIINYIALGPATLIMGWLFKAVALYFIFTSVRHAKEAEAAKKKLQSMS